MTEEEARSVLRALPQWNGQVEGRLEDLAKLLGAENARQNLVAAASLQHIWSRHILDSAQLLAYVPRGTLSWLDLGSGAGFPGLVVAIMDPTIRMTLVESRSRRVAWLEGAADGLDLKNVKVAGQRLETLSSARVDVISARAFAPLDRLVDLAARFSTAETIWLLPKGRSAGQELGQLSGWRHMFHVKPSVTDPDAGVIVGSLTGKREGQP